MEESIYEEMGGQEQQQTPPPVPEEMTESSSSGGGILSIITKKSPDKPIEEYTNHPLNYDSRKSTGRILRGLEGLFSELNFALVDILLGLLEKWKERKPGNNDAV